MLKNRLTVSTSKGFRRFVHDTHVTLGIYAFVFLFLMAVTGPYSLSGGTTRDCRNCWGRRR